MAMPSVCAARDSCNTELERIHVVSFKLERVYTFKLDSRLF